MAGKVDFPALAKSLIEAHPGQRLEEVVEHAMRLAYSEGYEARVNEFPATTAPSGMSFSRPVAVRVNGLFLGKTYWVQLRQVGEAPVEINIELDRQLDEEAAPKPLPVEDHRDCSTDGAPRARRPISAEKALLLLIESDLLDDAERKDAVNGLIQRLAAML
jgi:hypothetical protein